MTSEMDDKERRSYLKEEYMFLQDQYEDYDKRSLTIKGWVSGGATAALGLAVNSSGKLAAFLPMFVAIIVAVIWYLEAYWKLFQYALTDRIRIIEAFFRNDPEILVRNPDPFQVYHWWYKSYSRDEPIYEYEKGTGDKPGRPQPHSSRLRRAAFQRFVYLPYLPILLLCLLSFVILSVTAQHPERQCCGDKSVSAVKSERGLSRQEGTYPAY